MSEIEREVVRERTLAGLEVARARGRRGGRPAAISPEQLAAARAMRARKHTTPRIVKALGVRAMLYRHLALGELDEAA